MKFSLSFEFIYRYCNKVHTKHENFFSMFSISLEEQMQLIAVEVFIHLSVYLYLIIKLFVCVKRQDMSKNRYTSLQL